MGSHRNVLRHQPERTADATYTKVEKLTRPRNIWAATKTVFATTRSTQLAQLTQRVEKLSRIRRCVVTAATEPVFATSRKLAQLVQKVERLAQVRRKTAQLLGDTVSFFSRTTRVITNTLE